MTTDVRLTVVIATHRRNDLLERTLASLARCELPPSYAGAVVVENGGRHGAEEVVRRADERLRLTYVFHAEPNKSAALNQVLAEVGADWLVFFDDDVRIESNVLSAYARTIAASDGFVYLGGPVAVDYEAVPEPWIELPPSARGWTPKAHKLNSPKLLFIGFNWAARAVDLRRAGGFDPEFGPGSPTGSRGQESNMQRRLQAAGAAPVYVPDALVWHYVPRDRCSEEWSLQRAYQHGIEAGQMASFDDRGPRLFGAPYGRLLRCVAWAMGGLVLDRVGTREWRYRARMNVQRNLGFVKGCRRARASSVRRPCSSEGKSET